MISKLSLFLVQHKNYSTSNLCYAEKSNFSSAANLCFCRRGRLWWANANSEQYSDFLLFSYILSYFLSYFYFCPPLPCIIITISQLKSDPLQTPFVPVLSGSSAATLLTINVKNNYLAVIMGKFTLMYLNLRKLQKNRPEINSKLKNRNVVTVNINVNVSSLTRILIINYPTSSWAHAFEVPFTIFFT